MGITRTLHLGDCIETMNAMEENSVDSIVTDPPYELGFMGKSWDSTGIAFNTDVWRAALRVLKPGGHLLAFSGSRTYHRMAVAIEDAGFQIRDQIMWIYGSGFPKSMDISKAIDKSEGIWRGRAGAVTTANGSMSGANFERTPKGEPATTEAKQWQGWGTALKPAHEPLVLARKPLIGTVANNVLTFGVGGLNIDGTRVDAGDEKFTPENSKQTFSNQIYGKGLGLGNPQNPQGRWPANVIHDGSDEVLDLFPNSKGGAFPSKRGQAVNTSFASGQETEGGFRSMGDDGSAARFFYCAKANKRDRNEGLDGFEGKEIASKGNGLARTCAICGSSTFESCDCPDKTFINPLRQNHHPTVKPTDLMRYLSRLITARGGGYP